jgi:uncharacterized FlaG/YvyC family protein
MNIQPQNLIKFNDIQFSKNEYAPPSTIVKVVNHESGEVVRQIPPESQIKFHKSMTENSLIDVYA